MRSTALLIVLFIMLGIGARFVVNSMDAQIETQCTVDPWREPFYVGYAVGAGHMCNWSLDVATAYADQRRINDFESYLIGMYGYEAWDHWATARHAILDVDGRSEYEAELSAAND